MRFRNSASVSCQTPPPCSPVCSSIQALETATPLPADVRPASSPLANDCTGMGGVTLCLANGSVIEKLIHNWSDFTQYGELAPQYAPPALGRSLCNINNTLYTLPTAALNLTARSRTVASLCDCIFGCTRLAGRGPPHPLNRCCIS